MSIFRKNSILQFGFFLSKTDKFSQKIKAKFISKIFKANSEIQKTIITNNNIELNYALWFCSLSFVIIGDSFDSAIQQRDIEKKYLPTFYCANLDKNISDFVYFSDSFIRLLCYSALDIRHRN